MAEYTGKQQQKEEKEGYMDIQNIFAQELQEDEDINNFITELFNVNNTLLQCELDQWLEDYLEEIEIQQQQQQGEQSQEQSLLDMCQYSDISSVEEEEENSPSSGQWKENNYFDDEQDNHGDNLYSYCNCIFCSKGGGNIDTEPVPIQCGGGLPPMYGDQEEEEEEDVLGDDDDDDDDDDDN